MGRTPNVPHQLRLGPFSLEEARNAGITLSALRGRSWQRVGSKLYRWKGSPANAWGVINGFARTVPASAVFVGLTAAWMHGLDVKPTDPVYVAVGQECDLRSRAGLAVAHAETSGETETIRGLRATTLARTLLDLCARCSSVEALTVLDMAVKSDFIAAAHMSDYAEAAAGRPGAARLRRLAEWAAPAESPMESRLRWLILQRGLPQPDVQSDLHDSTGRFVGRADLYYPSAHLVIEFDGGNHRDRLVSDDRRQNSLVEAGYRVLRFTSSDVYTRPDSVVGLITASLRTGFRTFSTQRA